MYTFDEIEFPALFISNVNTRIMFLFVTIVTTNPFSQPRITKKGDATHITFLSLPINIDIIYNNSLFIFLNIVPVSTLCNGR